MSQAKVDEWLHADKGSPWRRADGGYTPDNPQISREDDAEILSHGRPQSRALDLNLTPPPAIRGAPPMMIPQSHLRTMPDMTKDQGIHPPAARRLQVAAGGGIACRDEGGGSDDPKSPVQPLFPRPSYADGGATDDPEPPDYSDRYNTKLSSPDEKQFQAAHPNPGDSFDYDMRGAWKSGATQAGNGHYPDTFKKPNHPTFSDQSQYHGVDGNVGGSWGGGQNGQPWSYTPSATNLQMHGAQGLQDYFKRTEPDVSLAMPGRSYGGVVRRDVGGGITADPGGGIGGIAPTSQTQNPLVQGQIQRYASLPTEKLMELGARMGGSPQSALIQKLVQQRHIAPQNAPEATAPIPGYAIGGGMMSSSEASPWWTRREASSEDHGFLGGTTGGTADAIKTTAPGGSYVIPAEVIAGLGDGNSLAGARVMDAILGSGPHGTPMPRSSGVSRSVRPPPPFREEAAKGGAISIFPKRESGGATGTKVALSDGEYVVHPKHVKRIGGGDIKRGHRILDAWVMAQHKKHLDKLKKYEGPVKT